MEKYNYRESIINDIKELIENGEINLSDYDSRDEASEALNDDLWVNDSVTGNGSGSYFCNTWKAEEALCHNFDLLSEAMQEFDCKEFKGAEDADVTIRCYLLGECISAVLDELWEDVEEEDLEEIEA